MLSTPKALYQIKNIFEQYFPRVYKIRILIKCMITSAPKRSDRRSASCHFSWTRTFALQFAFCSSTSLLWNSTKIVIWPQNWRRFCCCFFRGFPAASPRKIRGRRRKKMLSGLRKQLYFYHDIGTNCEIIVWTICTQNISFVCICCLHNFKKKTSIPSSKLKI